MILEHLTYNYDLILPKRQYMENKYHVSIKSPKGKSNIKHIKYIFNEK